jgi:hypothetical protein
MRNIADTGAVLTQEPHHVLMLAQHDADRHHTAADALQESVIVLQRFSWQATQLLG